MMASVIADRQGDVAWPRHAVGTSDRSALATILLPDITLAILRRAIADLPIGALPLATLNDIRLNCRVANAVHALHTEMAAAGYPADTIFPLADDIAALAAMLADLLHKDDVQIRLEVVDTNACRKFHADYVSVRLITTYVGPGTQWLDQQDAARLLDGAEIEGLTIRDIPAGHVALFKGREWNEAVPIVHRSPPVSGSGIQRLVLVIDPAARGTASS